MSFCLTNSEQCVHIKKKYSELETIILSVPQRCILEPILLNQSVNELIIFVTMTSIYNFEDDNALPAFSTTISELVTILKPEYEIIRDWFKKIKIVLNVNLNAGKYGPETIRMLTLFTQ